MAAWTNAPPAPFGRRPAGHAPAAPLFPGCCHAPCFSSAALPLRSGKNKVSENDSFGLSGVVGSPTRPVHVRSPWSAFVGSGGSAGWLRSISIALVCRCSSGVRVVVLLSSVLISPGGSPSSGVGSFSAVGSAPRPPSTHKPSKCHTPTAEKETNPQREPQIPAHFRPMPKRCLT